MNYRIDYLTKCGSRGVWHYELEASTIGEAADMCRKEFKDIKAKLWRNSDMRLKQLLIVKTTETVEGIISGR